nr:hypothetical protein Iba_scaffold8881CG0210 [Ipomoea batatas]
MMQKSRLGARRHPAASRKAGIGLLCGQAARHLLAATLFTTISSRLAVESWRELWQRRDKLWQSDEVPLLSPSVWRNSGVEISSDEVQIWMRCYRFCSSDSNLL